MAAKNLARQLLSAWLACLATSICLTAAESVVQTPKPTGGYRVGRSLLYWVDEKRTDIMEGGPKRDMTAVVWYPADARAKVPAPAPWMPDVFVEGQINITVRERRRSANPLTPEEARKIVTEIQSRSFENVPFARDRATHALLLFEPGSGINPAFYSSFCEDLASHGYVVVGISPTGWFPVTLPDGRRIAKSTKLADEDIWIKGTALPLWSGDLLSGLLRMHSLNGDPKSLFYRRINIENVGAFGHSMGGTSSIFTALRDDRIRAAADLDGSLFGILDDTTFSKPLLALVHDSSPQCEPRLQNETASLQQRVIEEITQFYKRGMPGYRVTITAARHITFSDATVLPPWTNPGEGSDRMAIMRSYIRAFFDRYLRGRKSALLEQAPGQYGIAEFQTTER